MSAGGGPGPPPCPPPGHAPPARAHRTSLVDPRLDRIFPGASAADPRDLRRRTEALREFHRFSKRMKMDAGLTIKTLAGGDLVELDDLLSDESADADGDGDGDGDAPGGDRHFAVDPDKAFEPDRGNDSIIDPETGDFVQPTAQAADGDPAQGRSDRGDEEDGDDGGGLLPDGEDLGDKLKDMAEISIKPIENEEDDEADDERGDGGADADGDGDGDDEADGDGEKDEGEEEKTKSGNAINVRRNIREVMDEKQLDASTLAAQRLESERLARVQEQQRMIREVRRQIALSRQEKAQQRVVSFLQGGASVMKKSSLTSTSAEQPLLNLPDTVLMKLQSGDVKKPQFKPTQLEHLKVQRSKGNLTPSVSIAPVTSKPESSMMMPAMKKEVVEIVDSSSESSSSESAPTSDSDDCIILSDSELPPSPEPDEDPQNSGLHVNDAYNIPDDQGRVVINVGHPENEEDIFLAPQIARIIKPHQIGGVRFLFDNIIESVERFSTSTGFGCILAHSMGLGKTLQIVCFCDIFLRHTNSKTVLCIMPINTLQNWVAEFNMWLPLDASNCISSAQGEVRPRKFPIFVLNDSHKTLNARAKVIKDWATEGGVLLIGYELYRLLSLKKNKKPKGRKKKNETPTKTDDKFENGELKDDESKEVSIDNKKEDDDETDEEKRLLDEIHAALVKPGPDLVICDEGHRIKNSHSNISYALKQMRTKRRIVLTGYPLQNNLLEYWCMVDFVRPNYLGTKTEFSNMFERPIQNGQCIDSTPQDIRLMRYRAHVLHSLLVGFVQRRSHAVLQSTLPQKEEYVMLVRFTALQRKLYDTFMNEVVRKKAVPNPLKAFAVCCKIWNHPDVLFYFLKKRDEIAAMLDYDLDLEDGNPLNNVGANPADRKRRGKPRGRPPTKRKKVALNANSNTDKPAATIPPNTSNININSSTFQNVTPIKQENLTPAPYQLDSINANPNSGPGSYPSYSEYNTNYPPQNTNFGSNEYSYNQQQQYSNNSYYQSNQQYSSEFNTYNQPTNATTNQSSENVVNSQSMQGYQPAQNQSYNNQGYWNSGENNFYNQNQGYYPNQNQQNYQNQPNQYNNVYDPYNTGQYNYNLNSNEANGVTIKQEDLSDVNQTPNTYPATNTTSSNFTDPNTNQSNGFFNNTYPYSEGQGSETEKNLAQVVNSNLWSTSEDNKSLMARVKMENPDLKGDYKNDSDGEVKIADLDTKIVINDKKSPFKFNNESKPEIKNEDKESTVKNEENDDKNQLVTKTDENLPEKQDEKLDKESDKYKIDNKNKKEKDKKSDDSDNESDLDKKDEGDKKVEFKEEVPFEWSNELLKGYVPGIIENSAKMEIFFCILEESVKIGDRVLLFSQSLFTLNLIEDFLQRNIIPGTENCWLKNKSYFRLDGSTSALEREKLINEFNCNSNVHLFLVSTRAGSLGINLVGANRVIVFDASWNPCHDTQAVCRVYRYGQQKPCYVYRLVMDCCLEKKIYDRQINKQGMSDRVVDECNPDAVLSMKEVTNLCWDNDEKETPVCDLLEFKDKYVDDIMKKIIVEHAKTLSKEPFQHESLLVDRKEKKLSSAEKRLAQRGYEMEKKANANPKPNLMYRTIRTADGSLIQRPVASVRPMQHTSNTPRWIPAEVWQRQGMTAQEMTLPLDVVIPTNSAEKSNIVLKAGQRVMVLKSPKGIYMQLETGKIIAIKTSSKLGQNKPNEQINKEHPNSSPNNQFKKILSTYPPNRPQTPNLPVSLKNNSAITVTSKNVRSGFQKVVHRPNLLQHKLPTPIRNFAPGQRIQELKIRPLASNVQPKYFPIIRGRSPQVRPTRPIPIQNRMNLKIPSISGGNVDTKDGEFGELNDASGHSIESESSNQIQSMEKLELNSTVSRSSQDSYNSGNNSDTLESNNTHQNIRSTLEDGISEDSSQEKIYADLSDKGESKIMVNKKSPAKMINNTNTFLEDCKIPIKTNFNPLNPADVSFVNEVTIKRTGITNSNPQNSFEYTKRPRSDIVNAFSDENLSSENSFSECRIPIQPNLADENSQEDDYQLKDKTHLKQHFDRAPKISSLKNYRHTKPMPKSGDYSPASMSSTPTPPPASTSGYMPSTIASPIVLHDKFESSLSQLEKATSSINPPSNSNQLSNFQQSLSDITKTYPQDISDSGIYKPGPMSRKKKLSPAVTPDNATSPNSNDSHKKQLQTEALPQNIVHTNVNSYPPFQQQPIADSIPLSREADPSYSMQTPDMAVTQQPYSSYPGYPATGGSYPPYGSAPYYQPYPPPPYTGYSQYPAPPPAPPYATGHYTQNPYPGYPPYTNTNPHQW